MTEVPVSGRRDSIPGLHGDGTFLSSRCPKLCGSPRASEVEMSVVCVRSSDFLLHSLAQAQCQAGAPHQSCDFQTTHALPFSWH